MKAKTRKTLERVVVILIVLVFIIGSFLLYLPLTNSTPAPTSQPPVNPQAPAGQPAAPGGDAPIGQ